MPLPMPTPSRASRRPPTTAGNGPGNNGAPGSYSSSPNLGGAGASFGSPRATTANTGAGLTGSPLPTSRLLTPRAAGLGGGGTPSRIPGGGAATTRPPMSLSSHQQLQKALQGGGTGGANGGEAVKVRGSPIPAEGLEPPAQVGRSKSTSKQVGKTNDEEEPEDDGYDEDEEGADDEDGDVDDDEIMEEVTLSGLLGTESIIVGGTGDKKDRLGEDGSEFFGSMEMDDNSGEKMEEDNPDLDPDPETEEVPTTDTGEVGGSTTDDGARKRGGVLHGVSGLSRKTAPTPPVPGRVTRSSTRESDREREKKEKQARDKAKMPPPPPMVKRNPSTATRSGVKASSGAAGKEGTTATTTSRIRATSTATNTMATGGINRTTSVRKGSASKDEPSASTGTKSRSTAEAKTSSKPTGSTAANTTRHMRTRSVASGAAPSLSSSARQNGATTGTDSEDPATSKRKAARTGLAKKPRPVSMFVSSTTKAGTGGESDGAPPSPTAAAPPIASGTRSRQPTGQSKDTASIGRKPSTRAAAGTTTTGTTTTSATATTTQSHRRNQSEAQLSTQQKSSRPEFTTLQKDFSAPAPPPKQYLTEAAAANAALLPDAPTLQKQTHLLQLLLLHNTAIQSFQSFHADAHAKLSQRYGATAELYRQVRERLCADARTADMAVLSNVLSAIPVVPPIGGIARWGTASARRLSGSRDHLARGDGRRKTLTGEMASPVEERIQVLSESIKRVEGLLRKGGEVARVRAPFEAWIGARMNGRGSGQGEGGEEGLPKQWHRDWATVKRKLEVAVDGVKDFWVAYQHVLNEDGNGSGGGNNNHNVNGNGSSNGASSGTGSTGSGSGGTLVRMVLGFLELGEDVIRELDDMKNLEKLWVDEARERMRKVVREVMMTDHDDNDDGGERMEGVETEGGGVESIGGGGGGQIGGIWRL